MARVTSLAPPIPGFADATVLAPERTNSAAPTPATELASPLGTPGILVSGPITPEEDETKAPDTVIPPTDTLTTRPTRGGIAYPFRLKVDGKHFEDANASTLTLESVQVLTPGLEGEAGDGEGNDVEKDKVERPGTERFYTAEVLRDVVGADENPDAGKKVEDAKEGRPGVERFETAVEDLKTVAERDVSAK